MAEALLTARNIQARVHGRYLVDVPQGGGPWPLLAGFHGYAERAEQMLDALRRVRGDRRWLLVSVQALNRFYTRAHDVVANWMTREDRELAIADNIAYVSAVVGAVARDHATRNVVVYAGFSQGAAMAYRAAAFGHEHGAIPRAAGVIVLAGDVPPDVAPHLQSLAPVLIGRGTGDDWYTTDKAAADLDAFASAGATPAVHVFDGGHVWHPSFVEAAGAFLDTVHLAGDSQRGTTT